MIEPWVSADDVAKHLGVAKDSVYRWFGQKCLPAHRMGRLWKFKIPEVDEWVRTEGKAPREDAAHQADGDRSKGGRS
jgi:excisionase family DNA binding protein